MARGEARPPCELRTALCELRGLSDETLWGGKRAGHTSRNPRAATTAFQSLCSRSVAVLVQSSLSQRLSEERSSRWPTTEPMIIANCAARAPWAVGRYSTRRRARGRRAMGAERGGQRTFKVNAANLPRCWCSSASAGGLARSAPHVGPQHNPRQLRTTRRVLRGRSADTPRGGERAGRALWEPNAVV